VPISAIEESRDPGPIGRHGLALANFHQLQVVLIDPAAAQRRDIEQRPAADLFDEQPEQRRRVASDERRVLAPDRRVRR
jgi:hypothetical protein